MDKLDKIMELIGFFNCASPVKTVKMLQEILTIIDFNIEYQQKMTSIAQSLGVEEMNESLEGLVNFLLYDLEHFDLIDKGIDYIRLTESGVIFLDLIEQAIDVDGNLIRFLN